MRCPADAAVWLSAALVAAAPAALAQSANCEAFKARIAADLEAKGIAGYALDLVPGRVAAPPGARVIGNCDGGAYSLLYRRWAGAGATSAAVAASAAGASASASASVADVPPARPATKPATPPKAAAVPRAAQSSAPAAAAAPAPSPTLKPVPVPASTPPPPEALAAAAPMVPASVGAVPAMRSPNAAPSPAAQATTASTFDAIARRVAWVVAGLLLAYGGLRWWRHWRHHRYYDEAGLPRGPRIRL
jgi:hypothetical protein